MNTYENKIALYAHFGNSLGAESYLYDRSQRAKGREELRIWSEHIEIMKNLNLKRPAEIDFNVASNLKLGA